MGARIAYVLTAFPTVSETFVEGEFRALMARGFSIDLYATRNFQQVTEPPGDGGELTLSVCRLPYFWSREVWKAVAAFLLTRPVRTASTFLRIAAGNLSSPRFLLQALALFPKSLGFARRMERNGTAHVHGTWGHYPATCAYVVARLLDIPFSFSAHAGLDVTSDTTFLASKIRAASFVLTCNEVNRRFLLGKDPAFGTKIHTVYHGVTLSRIPPPGSVLRAVPPEILSVGRLAPEKGFLDLLEACRLLRLRQVPFRLRIYGDGPERSRLEEAIRLKNLEDVATLEGVAPHGRILEAEARATLVVLASSEGPNRFLDGIANVLVEAMACGTPVVSTSYPGSRELLLEGAAGCLVPQRDPPRLAEALEILLGDPTKRAEMEAAGRRRVVSDFDREQNVERIAALFRSSLGSVRR